MEMYIPSEVIELGEFEVASAYQRLEYNLEVESSPKDSCLLSLWMHLLE